MQTQRTVDGALSPLSTRVGSPAVPRRSTRRATALRARNRRATAREREDDLERRIAEYLKQHPHSTTGDMAKGLNANRGAIAASASRLMRAGEISKGWTAN